MKFHIGSKKMYPRTIPRDQRQRYLDHPVAQLPDVVHERHPALGVRLPLRVHETLADDAGALDGTG